MRNIEKIKNSCGKMGIIQSFVSLSLILLVNINISQADSLSLRDKMNEMPDYGQKGRNTCAVFAAVALLEYVNPGDRFSIQELASRTVDSGGSTIKSNVESALVLGMHDESVSKYSSNRYDGVHGLGLRKQINGKLGTYDPDDNPDHVSVSETIRRLMIGLNLPIGLSLYPEGDWWDDYQDTSILELPSDYLRFLFSRGSSHAVVVVGFDDSSRSFEIRNSWGKNWKDGGYGRVSYDYVNWFYKHGCDLVMVHPWQNPNHGMRGSFHNLFGWIKAN